MLAAGAVQADTSAWKSKVSGWREQFPLTYEQSRAGRRAQAAVLPRGAHAARRAAARSSSSGVGQHQMWASQYWRVQRAVHVGQLRRPRHDGLLHPGRDRRQGRPPDRTVWAVDGDGCFQMTAQELVTATVERHPDQGRAAQQQLPRHGPPVAGDVLRRALQRGVPLADVPDFVKWAEAMGCVGIRVESPEEVDPAIEKANSINDRPVVIEFRTDASREGVPDGPGRLQQRRPDPAPHPARSSRRRLQVTTHQPVRGQTAQPPHPVGARPEPARRARPRGRACSPGAASTSSRSRSPRPRTRASAASRSSSTSSRRRSSRSPSSCSS